VIAMLTLAPNVMTARTMAVQFAPAAQPTLEGLAKIGRQRSGRFGVGTPNKQTSFMGGTSTAAVDPSLSLGGY
jgi:hypothetical protein